MKAMKTWNNGDLEITLNMFEPIWDIIPWSILRVKDLTTGTVIFQITGYTYCELSDLYATIIAAIEPDGEVAKSHDRMMRWIMRP